MSSATTNRNGRRSGRGGRGNGRGKGKRGKSSYNSRNNNPNKKHERELKFSPQNNGKTTYATYATTRDAVIQHVQKSYKGGLDIAQSLEEMAEVDLTAAEPVEDISAATNPDDKIVAQTGMDIKYQEELRRHLDRKDMLKEGLNKAYALIFARIIARNRCNRG